MEHSCENPMACLTCLAAMVKPTHSIFTSSEAIVMNHEAINRPITGSLLIEEMCRCWADDGDPHVHRAEHEGAMCCRCGCPTPRRGW